MKKNLLINTTITEFKIKIDFNLSVIVFLLQTNLCLL